jgi:EAL and modified HD-GYP domain-containing signal transduction protein
MGSTPSELLTLVLVRARTCELLATTADLPNSSNYFTVGLLSALDAMLKVNMREALAQLPLAAAQKAAIERQEGEFGEALKAVFALELGRSADAQFRCLSAPAITACYLSAIAWADNLTSTGMLPS